MGELGMRAVRLPELYTLGALRSPPICIARYLLLGPVRIPPESI